MNKDMILYAQWKQTLYGVVKYDAEVGNYAAEYIGEVTDTYDEQGNENIYYYKGENPNNNLIFGGFCWQMVRTTATGGVKMIYNGTPNDGTCNNSGIDTQIGTSRINISYTSLAHIEYMYNKEYNNKSGSITSGSLYGKGVKYKSGTYTLTGTSTTKDTNHHYSCNNDSGTCSKVRYYYYYDNSYNIGNNSYTTQYYIELSGGTNVQTALNEMLKNNNLNKNNSVIKKYIDNWYASNMINFTNYFEDVIFCNDRSISNLSGWNPSGGILSNYLNFGAYSRTSSNLKCKNITDKFSMSNNKAKLTYPVGLLTMDEVLLAKTISKDSADDYYLNIGYSYWLGSPYRQMYLTSEYRVFPDGSLNGYSDYENYGVRPAVSLKSGTIYSEGDGSKDNPYIINLQ